MKFESETQCQFAFYINCWRYLYAGIEGIKFESETQCQFAFKYTQLYKYFTAHDVFIQ